MKMAVCFGVIAPCRVTEIYRLSEVLAAFIIREMMARRNDVEAAIFRGGI
jgi:hypothetical protein